MIKVYYSGVWDLLHAGHVHALRKAAALGNHLTVGVITDEFAASYKARPIVPYQERAFIVSQLCFVDEVVPCRWWDDNLAYCLEHDIAVRVVGENFGQQHPLQKSMRVTMERLGIRFVAMPRTSGVSTTLIKERIVQRAKEKGSNSDCLSHSCAQCGGGHCLHASAARPAAVASGGHPLGRSGGDAGDVATGA